MTHIVEICAFEQKLSLIMGHPIHLRTPEVVSLDTDALKKVYFRRAHECHPDKAASLGIAPEILTVRFRSLQEAYDEIRAAFESGEFAKLVSERHNPFTVPNGRIIRKQASRPSECPPQEPQFSRDRNASATSAAGATTTGSATWASNGTRNAAPKPRPSSGIFHAGSVPAQKLRFAQYLFYTRRIDWDALIGAMSWQYSMRPKLGSLGIELGYLSHDSVCAILRSRGADEFFGDAAVRLGLLKPAQLIILVGRQRLINVPIGRFFVERGYLSEAELAECLDAHHIHNIRVRAGSRISGQ